MRFACERRRDREGVNRRGSVTVAGTTLEYTVEGAGIPLMVLGSSIYYPRTFSHNLRESCTLVCVDLPHFAPLGRTQAAVGDEQFVRSMIPHRSGAPS